ncbi:MAG: hypothetical protein IAG13_30615 [Deltaproteobacteria bacterium]|nr:hypothetical protein [Nannocystaceae bacterium]
MARGIARLRQGSPYRVEFTTPIISVCLAAEAFRSTEILDVVFSNSAGDYADNIGLTAALRRETPDPTTSYQLGRTYSPLEGLWTHAHTEICNDRIGRVLRQALTPVQYTNVGAEITRIIGELHDNVPSHAQGRGFSAAQVFGGARPKPVVRFAIADNGIGLRRNASKVEPTIDDRGAVEWAFKRGTTSWRAPDEWGVQRGLGGDEFGAGNAPDDHHAGEGLADLADLVERAGGAVWVASGSAQMLYSDGTWKEAPQDGFAWPGVAIELELPLDAKPRPSKLRIPSGLADLLG